MYSSFQSDNSETRIDILEHSKILIIEDSKMQMEILRNIFNNYGFINIFEAYDGYEGIEKTKEICPDLVVLDMEMPIKNGFEYLSFIRNEPKLQNISVIVQTGLTEYADKVKIFEAGATDYIEKPVNQYELTRRSCIHLERDFLLKDLRSYKDRIELELSAAKKLQESVMPSEEMVTKTSDKFDMIINSHFDTSSEMGGDMWGFGVMDDSNKLVVYNVDFSGHGVNAALNTFRLHTLLRSTYQNNEIIYHPGEYMEWLNSRLANLLSISQYATMFYGVIDFDKNELSYATAATTSPIIFNNSDSSINILSGDGFPLGSVKDASYKTKTVPFYKNSLLFLYSDALIETTNKEGGVLSEDVISGYIKDKLFDEDRKYHQECFYKFLSNFYTEHAKNLVDDLTISLYYRKP